MDKLETEPFFIEFCICNICVDYCDDQGDEVLYTYSYPHDECRRRIVEEGIPAVVKRYTSTSTLPSSLAPTHQAVLDRKNWVIRSTGDKTRDLLIQASRNKRYALAGRLDIEEFSTWYSFESDLRMGFPYTEEQKTALQDALYRCLTRSDLEYVFNEIFGANCLTVELSRSMKKEIEEMIPSKGELSEIKIPTPYPIDVDYFVRENPRLVKVSPDTVQLGATRFKFELEALNTSPKETSSATQSETQSATQSWIPTVPQGWE
jgi:hypothetical protein